MNSWDISDWLDHYNERAAILQYDAGHTREAAEFLAKDEIIQAKPEMLADIVRALEYSGADPAYWARFYGRTA